MSNQVPADKWDVAGWYVTCISNCVLGNTSLNAIDSWGIQHYAVHQSSCLDTFPTHPCTAKIALYYGAINNQHNHRPQETGML